VWWRYLGEVDAPLYRSGTRGKVASRFSARSGSGNLDCRSNHPDVLHNGEGPSRRPEQTKELVMMIGSWACRVSSEIRVGGRCVSEPIHDNKARKRSRNREMRKT
jgi:hypothetical protein